MNYNNNYVKLTGNIGNEPEIKATNNGYQILEFTLAVSKKHGEEFKTQWHRIKALGRTAEMLQGQLHKGMRIMVHGELEVNTWKDENGKNREATKILVDSVSRPIMAPRADRPQQDPARGPIAPSAYGQPLPPMQDSFDGFNDDSIPF